MELMREFSEFEPSMIGQIYLDLNQDMAATREQLRQMRQG
jgi:hypothetical protein